MFYQAVFDLQSYDIINLNLNPYNVNINEIRFCLEQFTFRFSFCKCFFFFFLRLFFKNCLFKIPLMHLFTEINPWNNWA